MTAQDDYQYGERGAQHFTMCDEIDRLRSENDRLRGKLASDERAIGNLIDERDRAQEYADELAAVVCPIDVLGEHSNLNNPWDNALRWFGANGSNAALNEIDSLRRWKTEALQVLEAWEQVWIAAGCPGPLGSSKADSVRRLFERRQEVCGR